LERGEAAIFQNLYQRAMRAGARPGALRLVALVSFAESAVLPIPVDAVTLPVMLADSARIWRVVWVASLASVLGGAAGYGLGLLLYETVVSWLIELYGWQESFAAVRHDFEAQGAMIVAIGAVTPIPYKLIAIASGVERLDFALFLAISIVGRGGRFLFFGALVRWFGADLRQVLDRHAGVTGWIVLLLLVGGFATVQWLL
jgi:membrane protein YqaA with SNARE-associated domain